MPKCQPFYVSFYVNIILVVILELKSTSFYFQPCLLKCRSTFLYDTFVGSLSDYTDSCSVRRFSSGIFRKHLLFFMWVLMASLSSIYPLKFLFSMFSLFLSVPLLFSFFGCFHFFPFFPFSFFFSSSFLFWVFGLLLFLCFCWDDQHYSWVFPLLLVLWQKLGMVVSDFSDFFTKKFHCRSCTGFVFFGCQVVKNCQKRKRRDWV